MSELVAMVAARVRADYVFAEAGARAADALEAAELLTDDLATLCGAATEVLQGATADLHLRLVHHPEGVADPEDPEAYAAHWARQAAATAGGVRSVSRTPDGVAVLALGPFLGVPEHAGPWQVSALDLCHGASGVVLDLRECVGGSPDATALVCSFLLGPEPVHLTTVVERSGEHQSWTLPLVPGRRLGADVPVVVVVSGRTFSGGEELAFVLQELGRAQVVGETTRGGAHPRIGVKVHPEVELALPVASPRSPRTGRNWEGVGVTPDLAVPEADALDVALELVRSQAG